MPSTKTSPVKILSDLGYEVWEIENDADMRSALVEAINTISIGNPSDQRISILQDAVKNIQKSKFKVKKSTITGEAFKKGSSVGGAENVAGGGTAGGAIVKAGAPGAIQQAQDISQSPVTSSLLNAVQSIAASVDNIVGILKGQADAQQDATEDARVAGEEKEGKGRERGLEAGSKILSGLKKTGEKILKPVKNLFFKIFDFFMNVFLGRAFIKIIEFFSDAANQEKISTFFKFLRDWWPAIVAGLLAFAGPLLGPIGTIAGIVALAIWGVPKIIDAAKYVGSLVSKVFAFLKGGPDGDNKVDTTTTPSGVSRQDARHGTPDKPESPKALEQGDKEPSTPDVKEPPVAMASGGQVPGSGNRDTVPAMLTPGEFVMSRGAVKKWGAGTMASMNAAGGGTNRPTVMNNYNTGGPVIKTGSTNFNLRGGYRGYRGGGLITKPKKVRAFAGGGPVPGGENISTILLAPSQGAAAEISPPPGGRVRTMQAESAAADAKTRTTKQPGQAVPEFSASTMISTYKIKTLGITV